MILRTSVGLGVDPHSHTHTHTHRAKKTCDSQVQDIGEGNPLIIVQLVFHVFLIGIPFFSSVFFVGPLKKHPDGHVFIKEKVNDNLLLKDQSFLQVFATTFGFLFLRMVHS